MPKLERLWTRLSHRRLNKSNSSSVQFDGRARVREHVGTPLRGMTASHHHDLSVTRIHPWRLHANSPSVGRHFRYLILGICFLELLIGDEDKTWTLPRSYLDSTHNFALTKKHPPAPSQLPNWNISVVYIQLEGKKPSSLRWIGLFNAAITA